LRALAPALLISLRTALISPCLFISTFPSRSKLSSETVRDTVKAIQQASKDKKRKFLETVELQIALKNYDLSKDKRFSGSVRLPYMPRPKFSVCILGTIRVSFPFVLCACAFLLSRAEANPPIFPPVRVPCSDADDHLTNCRDTTPWSTIAFLTAN
jgi:hypothetical protein